MTKRLLLAFLVLLQLNISQAQTAFPPFANDILRFKKQDSIQPPVKNAILFVGSSSFTRWKNIESYFPGYNIINRGFGGSTLIDVIRYAYDVIIPYQPKQVVVYCGENDLAGNVPGGEVVKRFKTLYQLIKINLPTTAIHFVSIKPSPSRSHLIPQMKEVNQQVSAFLKKEKNAGFINVYPSLLDEKGNIREELFVEDKLHVNEKGYALWQKIILPHLTK